MQAIEDSSIRLNIPYNDHGSFTLITKTESLPMQCIRENNIVRFGHASCWVAINTQECTFGFYKKIGNKSKYKKIDHEILHAKNPFFGDRTICKTNVKNAPFINRLWEKPYNQKGCYVWYITVPEKYNPLKLALRFEPKKSIICASRAQNSNTMLQPSSKQLNPPALPPFSTFKGLGIKGPLSNSKPFIGFWTQNGFYRLSEPCLPISLKKHVGVQTDFPVKKRKLDPAIAELNPDLLTPDACAKAITMQEALEESTNLQMPDLLN